uniref:Uncharacterized protein n=1 Tax=Amphimedon queenslandica TaxID=400682 RepID=A0A1X7T9W2_AMPQE
MDTTVSSMFDGDAVLFYCLEASGYVYSEPISSESNIVTVYPAKENLPDFPNINFAAFLISHRKLQSVSLQSQNAEPMTVVYGSIIKAWLNEGDSEANLFRLVSSHQEKGWGDDDSEVAELMTALAFSGRKFNYEIQSKIYERTLAAGTVHNHQTNPNVREVLNGFVEAVGSYLEKFGININRRSFTYNYDELLVNPNEKFEFIIDDDQKNLISSMKSSLHQFLSTNEMHVLYTGDDYKGRNSIIAQVLGILVFLVGYGAYNTDDEVLKIINILISIINGRSDVDSLGKILENTERCSNDTPGNKIIFKIKFLALQSLNLLLQQHFHSSVKALLYDFIHIREKVKKLHSNEEEIRPDTDDGIELEEIAIRSKEESEFTQPPLSMDVLFNEKECSPSEKMNADSLKVKKLILILRNLIRKRKKEGLPILERINLEGVTLITLKLLCGVISKRINSVPRSTLNPDEFRQEYEKVIQPIQTILLENEIVETLIDLLNYSKDDTTFQVLACLNVLLYPGNEEAQKKITSHVNQQDKNLFVRVYQILRKTQSTLNEA